MREDVIRLQDCDFLGLGITGSLFQWGTSNAKARVVQSGLKLMKAPLHNICLRPSRTQSIKPVMSVSAEIITVDKLLAEEVSDLRD